MPFMGSAAHVEESWYRLPEIDLATINISAPIQIEVTHPLQLVLHVALVRLYKFLHYRPLSQEVRQSGHVRWVEHVHL